MTNVNFIANFLNANPGSTSVQVRKALCAWKGKEYKSAQYIWYFVSDASSRAWGYGFRTCLQYGYWEKRNGGWYLTEKGRTKLV